jgi:geranylgeranyl pyrophosphate synthase
MDYIKVLDNLGSIIEEELRKQFTYIIEESQEYHPFIVDVYKAIEEFVLRNGKRLASCSTLMVYKGYRNQIDTKIVKACSAIELYRHCILVHDDIVDADTLRRGGKTLHKILEECYDERFGNGSAIFVGNILYSLALRTILESGFENNKLIEVMELFSSGYKDVNESQILDLLFEYKEPTVNEWRTMVSKRASSLFRVSMLTGAMLASAPKKDISILENAAKHIGHAFDIQDDIIDTFASKEQYGREPCGDILKGKKPLHIIIAIERDRRIVSLMKDSDKLREKIADIKDFIKNCGALDVAKSISREHVKEATKLISMTEMSTEAKEFFVSFIRYIDESLDWYK